MSVTIERPVSVLGLFAEAEGAVRAVDELRRVGFGQDCISVISGVPYPEGMFGLEAKPSRVPFFSLAGAIVGVIAGFALAGGTALLYPIVTGAKPIVSLPTVGIIAYELMMLGALVMTVLGFLTGAKIPSVRPHLWDTCVSEGCLGVLVRAGTVEDVDKIEDIMGKLGAEEVRRFRERSLLTAAFPVVPEESACPSPTKEPDRR